jgi:site-specific recombinase XerD
MKRSRILKVWGDIDFKLYVPAHVDVNNKIEVHFPFFNPETGKNKPIKKSTGIDRYATEKIYTQQANILIESLIEMLTNGWNPITNSYPDYVKLTTQSNMKECIMTWLKYRNTDYENGVIQKPELEITGYVFAYYTAFLKRNNLLFEKPSFFSVNDINIFMRYIEKKRKLGKPTYNSYLYRLKFFYKYLVNERVISFNPCTPAHYYKIKNLKTRFEIFEPEELENIRNLMAGDPKFTDLYIACKFLFEYNIREAEQLRIKLGWINWKKSELRLPEKIIEGDREKNATKNGMGAVFELREDILELITEYIGERTDKNNYLFGGHCRPSLKKMHDSFLGMRWSKFREDYGISHKLKLYALKHTGNYENYDQIGLQRLSEIARHSSISQTQDYVNSKLKKRIIKIEGKSQF